MEKHRLSVESSELTVRAPKNLELSTRNSQLRTHAHFSRHRNFARGANDRLRFAVCRSPDPRDKRLRSSVYIETPETAFIVDTGTDFRTQALRENIRRVDAVVFTHSHTEHIMGFDDLRRFSWQRGSMPVYASAKTMADLERVFMFAFKGTNPFPGYLKPEPHLVNGPFFLGETKITPRFCR